MATSRGPQPRWKALVIIAVVAGGLFLLVKSGSFSFYMYSVTTNANGASQIHCYSGCTSDLAKETAVENGLDPSPMVRDALALVAADQDPAFTRATVGMRRLVKRARHLGHRSGATVFWTGAPKLLPTLDEGRPPSSTAFAPSTSSRRRARRVAKQRFAPSHGTKEPSGSSRSASRRAGRNGTSSAGSTPTTRQP